MRPLFYDFPEDKKAWEVEDEYMFGPDVLVCPVLYENTTVRTVYLPEGSWRNLETGEIIDGNATIECKTTRADIPVFIKSGSNVGI